MADFVADEDVPVRLNAAIRRLGHSIETVRSLCPHKSGGSISDSSVLEHAGRKHRIVLTQNRADFIALAKACPWHFGIVIVEPEDNIKAQSRRIDGMVKAVSSMRGQVIIATAAFQESPQKRKRKKRKPKQ